MSLESRTIAEDAPSRRPNERAPGGVLRRALRSRPLSPLAVTMPRRSTLANGKGCTIVDVAGRLDHDLRSEIAAPLRHPPLLNSLLRSRAPRWVWEGVADETLPLDLPAVATQAGVS